MRDQENLNEVGCLSDGPKTSDAVTPDHYNSQCSISCVEGMVAVLGITGTVSFCLGSSFKYLWRYENKGGTEDLRKARKYLEIVRDILEETPGQSKDGNVEYNKVKELYNHIVKKLGFTESTLD